MITVVVDDATRDRLRGAKETVELRDRHGNILACVAVEFNPPDESDFPTDEEIECSMREGRSYSVEQVMERLRSIREQRP